MRPGLVVITGGASGLGLATARRLAGRFRVLVASRRATERLTPADVSLGIMATDNDLGEESGVGELCERVTREVARGPLHALVHAAGAARPSLAEQVTSSSLELHFRLHVSAPWELTRRLLGHLSGSGSRVIFVGSSVVWLPFPLGGAYNASKTALHALLRTLRAELAGELAISEVLLGMHQTDLWTAALDQAADLMRTGNGRLSGIGTASSRMSRLLARSPNADRGAELIVRAVCEARPKPVYRSGLDLSLARAASALLPEVILDRLCLRAMGLSRVGPATGR